jgi:DNA-binding IclR family transcriptional regulator
VTDEGIKSARVAIAIVELLARHDELGVSEIARATGTTKARAFRHLRTLLALGYAVQKPGSERYARGPRMVALARVIGLSAEDGLLALARPAMQRLQERFPHSFNLSLVHGGQVSIVESLPGKALIGISVRLNQPIPLHATAAGKLFLAARLAQGAPLPRKLARFTDATIADAAGLRAELAQVAARGWADAPEQSMLGINAVSAPIRDHRGELVAMISAMDSIQFIPAVPPDGLIDALLEAAAGIGQRIDI